MACDFWHVSGIVRISPIPLIWIDGVEQDEDDGRQRGSLDLSRRYHADWAFFYFSTVVLMKKPATAKSMGDVLNLSRRCKVLTKPLYP